MIKLSKNKAAVIITSAALLSAVISCLYAKTVKLKADIKVMNILLSSRRVGEQNVFPHPTKDDLEDLTEKSCGGIAVQIEHNSYSDNDYGNYARECAAFILRSLADNMNSGETLAEYFLRKEKGESIEKECAIHNSIIDGLTTLRREEIWADKTYKG